MQKAAQRQFLIKVSGITGYFATKSGGGTTSETTDVYDGGSKKPDKLASPAVIEDLTIGRPFSPERDRQVLANRRGQVGSWRTTVSVQDTDADLVPIGPPTVYPNALLVGITEPEADAASGDASTFEMTFAVEEAV